MKIKSIIPRASFVLILLFSLFMLMGMASWPWSDEQRCDRGLQKAYEELKDINVRDLEGGMAVTRAVVLLGAAKIHQQFGKYRSCIKKVDKARDYLDNLN